MRAGMGSEYSVASDATKVNVDPRRNPKSDLNLQEVIKYAKSKGIGVFLYVNQRALYINNWMSCSLCSKNGGSRN